MNKPAKVHDRLAADLPINSLVAIAAVDDPYAGIAGEKINVLRSLRDDPLAGMHARDQIESYELQAGRRYQALIYRSQIGNVKAINPCREAVDGGSFADPLTDRQIDAFRELSRVNRELGQEGCTLTHDVLGHGLTLMEAASRRGMTTEAERKYIGRRFRECLATLAKLWHLST